MNINTFFNNDNKKTKCNNLENLENLDKFLENEKQNNSCETWSKLDKTDKIKKLTEYAQLYSDENNLTEDEFNKLVAFFKECLDRKKLQRVKDVNYDKNTGFIKSIPALLFNNVTNNFTLKNIDKRISTIKSLPPKKSQKTFKNKTTNDNTDSENDE
jgi:hypothetical protein